MGFKIKLFDLSLGLARKFFRAFSLFDIINLLLLDGLQFCNFLGLLASEIDDFTLVLWLDVTITLSHEKGLFVLVEDFILSRLDLFFNLAGLK